MSSPAETALAARLLAEICPDYQTLTVLPGGSVSRAFGFVSAGSGWVLRLRGGEGAYALERLAWKLLAPAGVPLPRLLRSGQAGKLSFIITAASQGKNPLGPLAPAELAALCAALLRLHAAPLPVSAAGKPLFYAASPLRSWPDYLGRLGTRWSRNLEQVVAQGLMPAAVQEELSAALVHALAALPAQLPLALIHGDLHRQNLFFEAQQLCAIVDWEQLKLGDPLYDLAAVMLKLTPDRALETGRACLAAYAARGFDLTGYAPRLKACLAHIALAGLPTYLLLGKRARYAQVLEAVRACLADSRLGDEIG